MAINSANYSISRIITVQISAKNHLIFNSIESFLFLWYPIMTNVLCLNKIVYMYTKIMLFYYENISRKDINALIV